MFVLNFIRKLMFLLRRDWGFLWASQLLKISFSIAIMRLKIINSRKSFQTAKAWKSASEMLTLMIFHCQFCLKSVFTVLALVVSNFQVNWSNVDHEIAWLLIRFVAKRTAKAHRRLLLDCLWFVMYFNLITVWIRGIPNHEFVKLYVTRQWVFKKFKVFCKIEFLCKL